LPAYLGLNYRAISGNQKQEAARLAGQHLIWSQVEWSQAGWTCLPRHDSTGFSYRRSACRRRPASPSSFAAFAKKDSDSVASLGSVSPSDPDKPSMFGRPLHASSLPAWAVQLPVPQHPRPSTPRYQVAGARMRKSPYCLLGNLVFHASRMHAPFSQGLV